MPKSRSISPVKKNNEHVATTTENRTQISKKLRKEVWEHKIGKKYESKCMIPWCTNKICALNAWHVGHDIAVAKGGTNEITNLYPICSECNLSMGTMTIKEFSNTVSKKKRGWRLFCC